MIKIYFLPLSKKDLGNQVGVPTSGWKTGIISRAYKAPLSKTKIGVFHPRAGLVYLG
jgi:hypothetical protein